MALRLIQLSDIHFGFEDPAALEAATAYVRETPFDLLAITGDITQLGADPEFAAAAAWLSTLPGPRLATPGNHDTPWAGLAERLTAAWARYDRSISPLVERHFTAPGLKVRSINSARGWQVRLNWSKGHVSRGQAAHAADALASAPHERKVVVVHHPLMEIPGGPMTGRVRGGVHAAERLTLAGADLILSGHVHTPFVQALPFGDHRTFAVGAGTLSRRLRGEPPGFNVIDIRGDDLIVSAMAWDGTRLQLAHAWEVKLRPLAAIGAGA
ncbi:metallophosphoesterase family protein [Caulobacter sp. KR2-114]|uniref:metallophosphoesterase family protein n=1 Tax=Caulobacter sp. KR2-114 TaxID=3400912 RepID=UPI003C0451D4